MIGERISQYRILEKLGSGGMGVVYRAHDESLAREVALKFLPPDLTRDEAARQRFVQEARSASALNHPNVCVIHEIGTTEDGSLYIVMPLYEGRTLKQFLAEQPPGGGPRSQREREPVAIEEAVSIALQIGEGLQAAHVKGIVHRDIKPANIIVTNDGRAVILDFGLAKLSGGLDLTKTGSTIGTTNYMSPEQVRGDAVDHRTDVWSLGVVMYEMLTGKRPFGGDYAQAVLYSILNEEPSPVGDSRTALESRMASITERCLSKDPDFRPGLKEIIALNPESSTAHGASQRAGSTTAGRRPSRRTAMFAGLAVLMAFAVLLYALSGGSFYDDRPPHERIPIAVVDFVNETGEPELDGLSGMLITSLEQSQRLSVMTRSRLFDVLDQLGINEPGRIDEQLGRRICERAGVSLMAIASIRKFGETYSVDLKVLDRGSDTYVITASGQGSGQESIPALIDDLSEATRRGLKERSSEIAASNRNLKDVTTVNLEAYQRFFEGEERLDGLAAADAVSEFEAAIALDSTFGLAYYRLGYALHFIGRNDRARKALDRALELIHRIPEKQQFLTRAYSVHLSHADDELESGLAILYEMEKRYPDDKEMLFLIGDWAYHAGHYEQSRRYLERVRGMDPNFPRNLFHLALLYKETGEFERMLKTAEHNLTLSTTAGSYWLVGGALVRLGRYAEAIDTLNKGLELTKDWGLYQELVYCYLEMGDLASAEAAASSALEVDGTSPWNRYAYVAVLLRAGRPDGAVSFARRLQSDESDFHARNLLAWTLVASDEGDPEAEEIVAELRQERPGRYGQWVRSRVFFPDLLESM